MHANNNVLDLIIAGIRNQPLLIIGRVLDAKVLATEGKPPKLKITMVSPAGYHDIWIKDAEMITQCNNEEFGKGSDIVVSANSSSGAKMWGPKDPKNSDRIIGKGVNNAVMNCSDIRIGAKATEWLVEEAKRQLGSV